MEIARGRLHLQMRPETGHDDAMCAALEMGRGVEGRAIGAERAAPGEKQG